MEFSTRWIADYVDLPAGGVDELAERWTAAGLAVEGRREVGDDVVLDLDVTTNRPDCMNHLGLAREAAVLTGQALRPPSDAVDADTNESASDLATLVVEDFDLCPRYTAVVLRGVEVGPSPAWLVERLEAIGSRSINNIVDVTNYVLWETGQPLHAFDLRKIGKNADGLPEVRVRRARDGETLTTLDGAERRLDREIQVIADANEAIALAGIMGGLDSEVTDATVDVLLESAHFDPGTTRKGASKLGMKTDASHRYERGADPEACLWAARRAAALMVEVAGGRVVSGHLEEKKLRADWPPKVDLDLGRLNAFGGTELDAAEVDRILSGLGFALERHGSSENGAAVGDAIRWTVTVPSWRWYDFEGIHAQDVYEEVLRTYGFDNIPTTLPAIGAPDGRTGSAHKLRRKVQDVLSSSGLTEAINFAFHDRARDAAYPSLYQDSAPIHLLNPLSDRYDTMRRSLLPNLVDSARFNQRRNADAVRLFEIGHVFAAGDEVGVEQAHDASDLGHDEMDVAALVVGGRLGTPWEHRVDLDFYDAKGLIEILADELGVELTFRAAERPKLHAGETADILLAADGAAGGDGASDGQVVGYLGRFDEDGGSYPLYVAEIALGPLDHPDHDLETDPPSRFPGIAVDTTLTHSVDTPWREIAATIEAQGVHDLVHFHLVDRYDGQGVAEGQVNTTINFLYNADDRSLTQDEVNERHQALAGHLEERFGRRA